MRKLWKSIPSVIRWSLVTMLILTMVGGAAYAYVALTAKVEVTIEECLSFVGSNSFEVGIYPGEATTVQVTIANASSADMEVELDKEITPEPDGLTVSMPKKVTIPGQGQETVNVNILVSKSAVPDTYTVSIDFNR